MMTIDKLKLRLTGRLALHLYFWCVVYGVFLFLNRPENLGIIPAANLPLFMAGLPVLVYLHFFIIETFFNKKRYYVYLALLAALIPTAAAVSRSLATQKMQQYNSFGTFVANVCWFLILTTGLKFLRSGYKQKLQLQQLKKKQLETRTALLKTAINPRFMIRTLDRLHTLSMADSPLVPEIILKLSQYLRCTIDQPEQNAAADKAPPDCHKLYLELQNLSGASTGASGRAVDD